jgi:hypothetical protein
MRSALAFSSTTTRRAVAIFNVHKDGSLEIAESQAQKFAAMFPDLNNHLGDVMFDDAFRYGMSNAMATSKCITLATVTEVVHSEEFVDTVLFVSRLKQVEPKFMTSINVTGEEYMHGLDVHRTTEDVFASLN